MLRAKVFGRFLKGFCSSAHFQLETARAAADHGVHGAIAVVAEVAKTFGG
jgi:hypothetical protein